MNTCSTSWVQNKLVAATQPSPESEHEQHYSNDVAVTYRDQPESAQLLLQHVRHGAETTRQQHSGLAVRQRRPGCTVSHALTSAPVEANTLYTEGQPPWCPPRV